MEPCATSLALIRRPFGPPASWLAFWNDDRWVYEFPVGRLLPREAPREALARGLREKLGDAATAIAILEPPLVCLNLPSTSGSGPSEPPGDTHVFRAEFDAAQWNVERIGSNTRWINETEIDLGRTSTRLQVSSAMSLILRELEQRSLLPFGEWKWDLRSRWEHWRSVLTSAGRPHDVFEFLSWQTDAPVLEIVDLIRQDFTEQWHSGHRRTIQEYFTRIPQINGKPSLKIDLIVLEYRLLTEQKEAPALDSYAMQFPDVQSLLLERFRLQGAETGVLLHTGTMPMVGERLDATVIAAPAPAGIADSFPATIGRYVIERVLGAGKFGAVFQAMDETLNRRVAIKLAHRAGSLEEREAYLAEARHLAVLNHPRIVPIYDFGALPDGRCYFVQKFILGESLVARMRRDGLGHEQAARIVAEVAEALHHAHCQQIVHRDIKPANIILDETGLPHVVDFGLAANDAQQQTQPSQVLGTPLYMSPEQIRGEVRYLDGRADVWGLGVILYELLAGRRPFGGGSLPELLADIQHRDPKPLRVLVPDVPVTLERICLRCLQKRKTDRYATASDLANELRQACRKTEPPSSEQISELLRVIDADWVDDAADFPVLACSLMNRTEKSLVVMSLKIEVLEFRPIRGGAASRELPVISTLDALLPTETGAVGQTKLRPPVLIVGQDAVTVNVRLWGGSAEAPVPPTSLGSYRFRATFTTDDGWEAATHELILGRLATSR